MTERQRYPLMLLNEHGKPFHDAAGNIIVVEDAETEAKFLKDHPDAVEVPPAVDPPTTEELLAAAQAENEELKARLGTFGNRPPVDPPPPPPPPPEGNTPPGVSSSGNA